MSVVLPKELAYSPSLPTVPAGTTSKQIVLAPVNGANFSGDGAALIQFDLNQAGYLDPKSLYLRYRITSGGSHSTAAVICKIPFYTMLQRSEVIIGSNVVESINDYNVWCNLFADLQLDVAQKYGNSRAWGLNNNSQNLANQDGGTIAQSGAGSVIDVAGALPNILSGCEKLVPLGMMPNVRLQLTLERVANAVIVVANGVPAALNISNVELCYTQIEFPGAVDSMVMSMGEKFFIKTQGIASMANNQNVGFAGTVDLPFNMRLASVKSLFTTFAPISGALIANSVNRKFDSLDMSSRNGSYVYQVGGQQFPSREVSTLRNPSSILVELRNAVGGLHSTDYNSSISYSEFDYTDATVAAASGAVATTGIDPAKFYFGANLETLTDSGVLLSGVSTQSSPIMLRVNTATTTLLGYNITLFAMYDALLEIEPATRNASVKQ
jgi:hypothetical protein